ncbi:AzlD domain-containing protein [Eubacterium barkeri]|uniref:Branched-chain amino acid transport protein n=1 Tax=Eubacterium barkeri TaxID=1528 RepID=A0A1H3AIB2_EUBBA|nr:AzlD domain-containing protein [Eubacterium barkeri]SDX29078.1 Branched-chain amino acid transport protein [Eubacterium barkeri]
MSTGMILAYIAVMAGVTYAIRVLPLVLFQKEIKSTFIRSFLYYIPYAVLGAMTFPAIFFSTGSIASATVGLLVAVILAVKGKGLVTVAVFSCVAVLLTEAFMGLIP